jgi:hypothetical protein
VLLALRVGDGDDKRGDESENWAASEAKAFITVDGSEACT